MIVGYAQISPHDQFPALQEEALTAACCGRIFTENASGAQRDRSKLTAALDYLMPADTPVVWLLARLARSVRQLVETAAELQAREIGLRVLTQWIDTTSAGRRLVFHRFAAIAEFERELMLERTQTGLALCGPQAQRRPKTRARSCRGETG